MLAIRLEATGGRETRSFGPVDRFRIHRDILEIPDSNEVATFRDGFWRVGEASYLMMQVEGPTWVHFESPARRSPGYGPFDAVCVLGGAIRVGKSESQHLAQRYDQSGSWRIHGEHALWPTAVFTANGKHGPAEP